MKRFALISYVCLLLAAVLSPSDAGAIEFRTHDWGMAGVGDFNADGNPEVLWRNNQTGEMVFWYMDGTGTVVEQSADAVPDRSWEIVGVGDFDGDGTADILLKKPSTGQVQIWYLRDCAVIAKDDLATSAMGAWDITGVGDFNGDGRADIVWRNASTGESIVWFMDGVTRLGAGAMAALPPPWKIQAVGDFNQDGLPEIVWDNPTSGEVVTWHMHGLSRLDFDTIASRAPPWSISGFCNTVGDRDHHFIRQFVTKVNIFTPHCIESVCERLVPSCLFIRAPPIHPIYS